MKIIQENEYLDTMKNEVEPYLKAHCEMGTFQEQKTFTMRKMEL